MAERVRFNNDCAPIIGAEVGIELPLTDETEVGPSVLRQQADELRDRSSGIHFSSETQMTSTTA